MLLSEAWELRLHLADEVVRRRTVQVMETLIVATQSAFEPTDEALRSEYKRRLSEFEEPEHFSFAHVFLRPQTSEARLGSLAKSLSANVTPDEARTESDVFLSGYRFRNVSLLDISRQFGDQFAREFAEGLTGADPAAETWLGPFTSVFGQHWVWLEDRLPQRVKTFDEVSADLRRDLRRAAEDDAIEQWVDARLARYEVVL